MKIDISDILKGTPGITPAEGASLEENCVVMLHRSGHATPVSMEIKGLKADVADVAWNDTFDEQKDKTYSDHLENTERAAVGVSVLLAKELTDYTVIMRSRKGTGFDYYLGKDDACHFNPEARLEVSGIEKETQSNTVTVRFNQKKTQVAVSDNTFLPAYISIVEFGAPKALFDLK